MKLSLMKVMKQNGGCFTWHATDNADLASSGSGESRFEHGVDDFQRRCYAVGRRRAFDDYVFGIVNGPPDDRMTPKSSSERLNSGSMHRYITWADGHYASQSKTPRV
jgi:hypothetical protein